MNETLYGLLLAHFLGDFYLQTKSWAEEKEKNPFSGFMWAHIGVVTALSAIALGPHWPWALVLGATHGAIDIGKAWVVKRQSSWAFGAFVTDQIAHWTTIAIISCTVSTTWGLTIQPWAWHSLALFILAYPTGIFQAQFFTKGPVQLAQPGGLKNAGLWIGMLERALVYIFVIHAQYEAIGLLVTGKSILRFSQGQEHERTEYVLVGTLLSLTLAISLALVVQKALPLL